MTNAEAKKLKEQKKRKNAYSNRRHESIVATNINYNTIVYSNITLIMEDDGYAFDYVSQLLKKTYNFLNIELIGSHGEGCIHHLISYTNTSLLIIIYDKSSNIKLIQKIKDEIRKFKIRNNKSKVITITPKSFEEIILSYIDIQSIITINNKKGSELLNMIKDYATGKIKDYSLANYVLNCNRINDDMILEDWMELLTANTNYYCTHTPSVISRCWINDCDSCNNKSNSCNMIIPKEFGNYTAKSKIEYIALNSLSFFIVKAIDEHIGYKFRAVTRCKLVDNKTITEVL